MRSRRSRVVVILSVALLVLSAVAIGPAEAKKKRCGKYKPGSDGAGAEVSVVTDAATADKPVEVTVATEPGLGFSSPDPGGGGDTGPTSHAYYNVQVDAKAASTGLFVRAEFPPVFDYDLFLRDASGIALAYAAGFNQAPVPGTFLDGTGSGGHSETGAEQIDGYVAQDCEGFTIDLSSASTPGGDVTVKLWLGKPE